jgi:hypothetical protein
LARWGDGLYDDDQALYVRDRFLKAIASGSSPEAAARALAAELQVEETDDTRHVSILVLADLLAGHDRSVPEITTEAIERIQMEFAATDALDDVAPAPVRDAALTELRDRLTRQ